MFSQIFLKNINRAAAIDTKGATIGYGDIYAFAETLKSIMPQRSLAFVLADNDCGGLLCTMGLLLSHNVPLILNPGIDVRQLGNLIEIYQPAFIVYPVNKNFSLGEQVQMPLPDGYAVATTGLHSPSLNPQLSHLLPTSGSTGSPKLVRHSYANIQASAKAVAQIFEISQADRAFLHLPLFYTMGLSVAMSHLFAGATLLLSNLSLFDAKSYAFMQSERATSFTGIPFSYQILDKLHIERKQLPDLKLLAQGGGKMPIDLNSKFVDWCNNTGRKWIATYGQTEGTARMSWLPADLARSHLGSIGGPIPGGRLWLEDSNFGVISRPNVEGQLCYSGQNVTMGYAHKASDLLLGDERHGILRTGDMAYFDEQGCFYITGRISRFLKLFGIRVSLDDCERIVAEHFSMPVACIGSDSMMQIYIPTSAECLANAPNPDYDQMRNSVISLLTDCTHLPATVFNVNFIDSLPLSASGKILYSQLPTYTA